MKLTFSTYVKKTQKYIIPICTNIIPIILYWYNIFLSFLHQRGICTRKRSTSFYLILYIMFFARALKNIQNNLHPNAWSRTARARIQTRYIQDTKTELSSESRYRDLRVKGSKPSRCVCRTQYRKERNITIATSVHFRSSILST